VFIPVYGEDVSVIRKTAIAALAIHGWHRTWILDDGRSDEVKALASELGCHCTHRLSGGPWTNQYPATTVARLRVSPPITFVSGDGPGQPR
jgi:cellulose synthase/poly-beta-1,6-N-acetylglucosamine synthase-like glycosyltransferase